VRKVCAHSTDITVAPSSGARSEREALPIGAIGLELYSNAGAPEGSFRARIPVTTERIPTL